MRTVLACCLSLRGCSRTLAAAWCVFLLCLDWSIGPASVRGATEQVRPIAEITVDDDGRTLRYPSSIFLDFSEDELFLVNGGSSRVIVYGPDYFPRVSIGPGRGVDAPRGVFVTDQGQVYICQSRTASNPTPRITILNGAFFIEREILLDDIPDAANFAPSHLAVSREGLIYVAGEAYRGVLVLDSEGNFLRRLQPMDTIFDREALAAVAAEQAAAEQEKVVQAGEEELARAASRGDIPEEFRPRSSQQQAESRGPGKGPVRVRNVHIDTAGHIYLVSAETSRIYVYGADESFLFAFGEKGGTPRKLSQPRGVAVDEKRKMIYVADFMRHSILVYDQTGRYMFEFGGRGTGPGWFNFPSSISVNRHGQVIVADLFNQRVQVLEVEFAGAFPMFRGGQAATPSPEDAETGEEPDAVEDPDAAEEPLPEDSPGVPESDMEEEIITEEITDWSPPEFDEKQ